MKHELDEQEKFNGSLRKAQENSTGAEGCSQAVWRRHTRRPASRRLGVGAYGHDHPRSACGQGIVGGSHSGRSRLVAPSGAQNIIGGCLG